MCFFVKYGLLGGVHVYPNGAIVPKHPHVVCVDPLGNWLFMN
jgi:hypothetical protein